MSEMITGRTEDIHGNHAGYFYADVELRDLFAAFALAGLVNTEGVSGQVDWTAATAYDLADAMLAHRNQKG